MKRRTFIRLAAGATGGLALAGADGLLWPRPAYAATLAGPRIYTTSEWDADPPKEAITVLDSRPTKLVIHHTAGANSTDYSLAHAFALARGIQQAHFARGFIDSGQHFTISRGAFVLEGRHRSLEVLRGGTRHVRGAHCSGQNDVAVGIENEGTYTTVAPPNSLWNQLVSHGAYICQKYGIATAAIKGHRDFVATECPGDVFYGMLPKLRTEIAEWLRSRTWKAYAAGSSGEDVRTIQYLLRWRGYSLAVDGVFGAQTESTVKSFQSAKGLAADGIVGTNTWEALVHNARRGDSGDQVRALQSQLVAHGYSLSVDGAFGSVTESRVKSFETSKGLSADGVVGPDTWHAFV